MADDVLMGFRNLAVRDYQSLLLPITARVITQHLGEFLDYSAALIRRDADKG